jgi:hypothetical protein
MIQAADLKLAAFSWVCRVNLFSWENKVRHIDTYFKVYLLSKNENKCTQNSLKA